MVQSALGTAIVALCYVCLTVILFAPTIYVGWLSMVGGNVPGKRKRLIKTTVTTFLINAAVVVLLSYFVFTYFVTSTVARRDAMARDALHSAVASEKHFFASHGRYFEVGPVRGPYKDESGLIVKEDVILQVVPYWDEVSRTEAFRAYAVHVWGKDLLTTSEDGRIASSSHDSEKAARIQGKTGQQCEISAAWPRGSLKTVELYPVGRGEPMSPDLLGKARRPSARWFMLSTIGTRDRGYTGPGVGRRAHDVHASPMSKSPLCSIGGLEGR